MDTSAKSHVMYSRRVRASLGLHSPPFVFPVRRTNYK